MKKITLLLALLFTTLSATMSFAQSPKALVVGVNHLTNDGIAFVILEDIPNGEVIYFTDREYNNSTNVFNTGEFLITFTASGAITAGTVVYLEEVSSNNLTVLCTGGGSCGTVGLTGSFSIGSDGDEFYAFADGDGDPTNGVTEIYSVMFTGVSGSPGGNIPAIQDPTGDYPTAILVDGFPGSAPNRTEYQFSPASLRDGVSQANLENTSNYLHAQGNADLSTVEFTNLNLAGANPALTVTRAPASVAENSGSGIVYTFTLASAAASNITINFNVSGTATFTTDYTQSGAATFNATSGTVLLNSGSTTTTVTLTPVGDTTLEPDETAILSIAAGTGYDVGAPSSATGTITNDDTTSITADIAVVGTNHTGTEGFSFVALVDIAGGSTYYFTENPFDNNLLTFSGSEAVVSWTAPAGGVTRGTVIVATEIAANTWTETCDGGSCGTVAAVSGNFNLASNGEAFFAYQDTDTDHTNGITQVDAVLFTGTTVTPGGNIPAGEDPSTVYTGAVVVDGFAGVAPSRTEYRFPPERGVTVDQANFQNTANWFHAQGAATLDDTPFANIIISTGSANPTLTLAASPTTTVEDSGTGMVFTFTLSAPAASAITVNFSVGGTATLTTDYTVSGADTFTATSGTATIPMGGTSVAVTVTPVADAIVEPTETVNLMIASGTGYDGGSPNSATGSITNDDTSASDPLVAVMGMSHAGPDGFSFVAAQDIPAGTVVYFTEDEFDNTTLLFNAGGESVLQWTSPGGQIDQGDVITVTETTPDAFTIACSDTSGNGCGTIAVIVSGFSLGSDGETISAYEDSDTDPTNGVTDIYSMMFTGLVGSPGGNLPAIEDPTGIFLNALVVDGFPNTPPVKTEYTPASRAIPVGSADFENPANYDHAFSNPPALSTVPFASLTIVVTFTAPADLCVDAGVQTGLGGGTPTGGVYSGPGVTDDGNGMTYSFDPAAAGVGTHTITYTSGGGSASDDIEVFALPTVTFTALADLCIDAGVQSGLGGGTPTGGVYSGTGVTDDGNGMTYSFDPAAAGVGTHTLTYTFTDTNGCTNSASDDVEVFALPTVTFTAPADLCLNAGVQAGLGGGTPTGGVYSGTGVTDDGNGMTYSFDPAAAGVGTHTITYTFTDANGCTNSASDDVEVFDLPVVAFTAPADLCVDAGVQTGLGGGTPTGGVYSGPGVTDDGNGMTYSFDPAAAGVGVHTITYTFTDANGCSNSASDMIEVFTLPTVTFTALADLCLDAGVQAGLGGGTPTGGFYSGAGVTDDGNGMTYSFDPAAAGVGTHTLTYTFSDTNGCISSASDDVEVFALPNVTFTALADLCIDAGVQAGLGGGTPTGGVYSGTGVTDDGNGMTYSFDPAAAGVGTHTLTYTFTDANGCTNSASDDVEVFALPTVTFTAPVSPVCPNATLTGLGGGTPTGGVYSGPGVTDDGNGMTYTFDAATAGTGTHTITYTFTDANGCTNSASDTVTVEDTTPPVIVCPADITVGNTPGTCEAVVTYTAPVGTDNCSGATTVQTAGLPSGSAFPVGTTTNTFVVTDVAGNTATCSFDVIVNDVEPPTITCPGDITVSNDAGICGAVVNYTVTGMDNCSATPTPITLTFTGPDVFGTPYVEAGMVVTADPGQHIDAPWTIGCGDGDGMLMHAVTSNTWVYNGGNVFTPQSVEICADPADFVFTSSNGGTFTPASTGVVNFPATPEWTEISSMRWDNVGGGDRSLDNFVFLPQTFSIAQTAGLPSGSEFPVGITTNTFVITDIGGNTATCSFDVTVNDTEAPVVTCPADITVSNDPGNCSAAVTVPVPSIMENCPGTTTTVAGPVTAMQFSGGDLINTPSTITGLGTTLLDVILDIEYNGDFTSGSTSECFTLNGPDGTQVFQECGGGPTCDIINSSVTIPAATWNNWITNFGSDLTFTLLADADVDQSQCSGAGSHEFQLTANTGFITLTNDFNGTSDASGTYPVGTTTVVWTATDAAGNVGTCSMTVTVNDTEDPVITCPADIIVSNDAGVCGAQVNYSVTATDNCATVTPGTISINPLKDNSLFEETPGNSNGAGQLMYVGQNGVGENHRGVLAFDVAGSIPAGAIITGINLTMTADHPSATNGAHDFNLHRLLEDWGEGASDNGTAPGSGGGGFGVPGIAPDATWNDAMLGTAWVGGPGGTFNPASSAVQTVDANGPYIWSSAGLVSDVQDMLDNPGSNFGWIIIGNETGAGTTKRFGTRESSIAPVLEIFYETVTGLTITQTAGLPSGSTFPIGTTTNTFIVTDPSGNTDTCSFDVTVNDTEPPVAVCNDITIQLDANGDASITAGDIDGGSTDNCGIASLAVSPAVFDCSNVGPNTVTLTVTDVNGNVSTCTSTVTVEDNVAPDAVCMDIDVFLDNSGMASITPADVDGGSTDACGIASLSIDITDFTCADLGPNDVTLTVTDVNGNSSSCVAVVTVIDDIPPVISCPVDIITGTDPGLCSAQVVFADAIASDNCAVTVAQTAGLPSGSDFPVGVSTIEFTATDEAGNTTICSFTITVNDDEPAMAVCQDITIQLDANGDATITAADVDGGSSDNCGIASMDVSPNTFDCSNVGDNTVTLTVTDDNGNVSTCTAIVTVEDVTAPDVLCMDIVVDLDPTGTVTILPTDVDAGSTDACGIDTYELDIDTFDCSNVGDNTVTLTVTDVNGNSASCTAIVTVQDVTDPVLTCMDITVELDENGEATIVPEDVIDTLDDACGIFTTAVDIFEFSCDDIGTPVVVQVFAQDNNGNLATCTATVTVVDALAPVLTCPADQTVDPGPGNLFYEIPDYFAIGEATATDNCTDPVTDTTQDPAPGTLVPDGVYTITLTATDESGNTATCEFELTVESVLGVDDLPVDLSTIVIYPNPATDVVFISNPQNIALEKVTLFDIIGRKVATYDIRGMGSETSLDISNLATASYTVIIEGEGGQLNKRLIKE